MNQDNQNPSSISDDQELAKVLAGINTNEDSTAAAPAVQPPAPVPAPEAAEAPAATQELAETPELPPIEQPAPMPEFQPQAAPAASTGGADESGLEGIKQQALSELRPLVDKLDVSPEEKFDTYLLLLRSTDDKELVGPAHDAAVAITDEARRAQALLDIIKEIDFFTQPQK